MSIIQEALKKAQRTTTVNKKAVSDDIIAKSETVAGVVNKKSLAKKNNRLLLYALFSIVVVSVSVLIYFLMISPRAIPAPTPPPALPAKPPQESSQVVQIVYDKGAAPENPAIAEKDITTLQNDFVLSGIMHLEDGPRAIINNSSVMTGGYVNGAMVVAINENSVILKKGNAEITLRLK